MTKFANEPINPAFVEEIKPLISAHWQEIAHFKDIPLDPDFDLYQKIYDSGTLRAFTVRTEEGTLIGYALFFVKVNLHYKSSNQAVQDILFIHPEHRGMGRKFIAWCDEQLQAEGVQAVYHHMKAAHSFGPMLETIGKKEGNPYEIQDLIYVRRLKN